MAESSPVDKLLQAVEEYERGWQERLQEERARPRSPLDEISDETLKSRLLSKFGGSPPPDTIIIEACLLLEDRLRTLTLGKGDSKLHGVQLVDAVFDSRTGVLQFSSDTGEQEGVRMLYRGATQFIRNRSMHKLVEYPESTARPLIRLMDALLQLLSEGKPPDVGPEEKFFSMLSKNVNPSVVNIVKDLYDWGRNTADRISFGRGTKTGSVTFHYIRGGKAYSVFTISTDGRLGLNYGWLDREILEQLHRMITKIPKFKCIPIPTEFSRPSIKVADAFSRPEEVEEFKQAILWLRDRIDAYMKGNVISA
jgi:hypothetical protein